MSVVVVTGTPGTGKTLFTEVVAKRIGYKPVSVNEIALNMGFIIEFDADRQSYVVDLEALKRHVTEVFCDGNYIVEGHIAHLAVDRSLLELCVVLRCSPYVLADRLRKRGYSERKVRENVEAEILDIIYNEAIEAYGVERVIQLDTTKGVEATALRFIEMYQSKSFKSDAVDWLSLIYEKGDLRLFFTTEGSFSGK